MPLNSARRRSRGYVHGDPSTAPGGTTFSTPVFSVARAGTVTITAPLTWSSATAALTGNDASQFLNYTAAGVAITTAGNVPIIFATNTTEKMRLFGSGGLTLGAAGVLSDPGAGSLSLSGSVTAAGAGANTFAQVIVTNGLGVTNGVTLSASGIQNILAIASSTLGTGVAGQQARIGRNSSGSGAGGALGFTSRVGTITDNYIWADGSASPGVLRIKATAPVEDGGSTSDTSGTIVGTQTSTLDTKTLLGEVGGGVGAEEALAALVAAPVSKFTKKGGVEVFDGLIIDYSPWVGFDPDERHPFGRSFSEVNFAGYATRAIQALAAKVAALEAKLE